METNKQFFKDAIGWGFILWLIGYILGIIVFLIAPPSTIGWIITPIATIFTLWVLIKKIKSSSIQYYLFIGITWTIIAIILDYFLLVKVFKPEDGYYKLDVYLYYIFTLMLPIIIGLRKHKERKT